MLPNFLIIGAQKAATTWLKMCLQEHPDVYMPEQAEIHFFDANFERGVEWYESHFSAWSGQTAIGEKTPEYLSHVAAPGRIRAFLGDVKLIVSLRHPIDRAYSAFWHHMRQGRISVSADFPTFFLQDQYGLRSLGYYSAQLRRYLECFPSENVLTLIHEEVKINPHQATAGCYELLGVESHFVPECLNTKKNTSRDASVLYGPTWASWRFLKSLPHCLQKPLVEPFVAVGRRVYRLLPKQRTYAQLPEDLRQELLNDFMSDIKQLEILLDRDLSVWYAPVAPVGQDLVLAQSKADSD